MKKCFFCRRDLPIGSDGICDKCKKNKEKYGDPTNCQFCKLHAAFKDQKCVHCAYNERKHGAPIQCSQCKLKSAFIRDPAKPPKVILCRLCLPVHGHQHHSSSSSSKRPSTSNDVESHHKRHKTDANQNHHNHHNKPSSSSSSSFLATQQNTADVNVQAYKDKINALTLVTTDKNQQIKELQQKIVELEAEQLRKEKDYRQKLINIEKQHDSTISNLQDQIKQLNKELANKRSKH